ncbi:hypothetical protein C8R44DRAFT_884986 [Mycena epipterygia]|nr:hypothetical protein C8R44DRAFT_884986 [Mycena epipterygia]
MFFTSLFLILTAAAASVQAVGIPRQESSESAPPMPVFTVTRVYKTITDVAPYIVTATTTMTWTQSPSTTVANPTGTGV